MDDAVIETVGTMRKAGQGEYKACRQYGRDTFKKAALAETKRKEEEAAAAAAAVVPQRNQVFRFKPQYGDS